MNVSKTITSAKAEVYTVNGSKFHFIIVSEILMFSREKIGVLPDNWTCPGTARSTAASPALMTTEFTERNRNFYGLTAGVTACF